MATTSPDNIWSPDSGDDFKPTIDLPAMADSIQDAFLANTHHFIGTTTQREAAESSASAGQMWWDTTLSRMFVHNGATWKYMWKENATPHAIAAGTASVSASGTTTVNFPAGRFSVAPIVQANHVAAGGIVAVTYLAPQPTSTQFSVRLYSLSGAQVSGSIYWMAVQMTASTAAG